MHNSIRRARAAALAAVLAILCAAGAAAQVDPIYEPEPWVPPPNLFPSWLSSDHSPIYVPTTYQEPWIQTPSLEASGPWTLRSPDHGSFVTCKGSGGPFGVLPQQLVSSWSGLFGASNVVESPCFPAPGLYCAPPIFTTITPERVATATANAYVTVDAFWSFFESLGWQGFDNSGTPINVEFGEVSGLFSFGWNAGSNSVTFCPGSILHINHLAHELVHGLVAATADFSYNFSGSGGDGARIINEAYADFFAEMIEFHADLEDTSTNPATAGDYVVVTGKNDVGVAANFYAPSKPCFTGEPGGVSQAGWYLEGGPIRHAMYLMAEGTNPDELPASAVCQGPSPFAGMGRERTSKIWLDALVRCDWRQGGTTVSLCDARRCTIDAAPCPYKNDVIRAWNAVSMTARACGTLDRLCAISDEQVRRQ